METFATPTQMKLFNAIAAAAISAFVMRLHRRLGAKADFWLVYARPINQKSMNELKYFSMIALN